MKNNGNCGIALSVDISVVVPVHNVGDYLDECLNSLHCQTLNTAEFIVINDGSTDRCAEICDYYARLDKRFIVVHQECQGTLLARKRAFELARGKWCICVDGDDYLPFNTVLEKEVSLAIKHDVDILRFDMSAFSKDEHAVRSYFNLRREWVGVIETPLEIIQAIYANATVGWGMADKIYRTTVVKEAIRRLENVYLISGTDCYQLFLICFYSNTFKSVKTEPFYSYRIGCGISTGKPNSEKFGPRSQILEVPKFLTSFLTSQAKYEEYSPIINKLVIRLLGWVIHLFNQLPNAEEFNTFDSLFCNQQIKLDVLSALQKMYSKDPALLARRAGKSRLLQLHKRKIKKLGIFFPSLYNGEKQRYILLQASLFQKHGFEIVFFTEDVTDIDYSATRNFPIVVLPRRGELKRIGVFEKALVDNGIDLVIYDDENSPEILFDLLTVKLTGRFFVICQRENATRLLTQNYPIFKKMLHTYKLADSLVVPTSMEQFYYRSHGVNAVNIFNLLRTFDETNGLLQDMAESQDSSLMNHSRRENENRTRHVVWYGTLDNNQKNYREALEIYRRVCSLEQNVICHVVGKELREADAIYVKDFIAQHHLQNKIIYEGFSLEPERFLKIADVHLMTSSYECFPMSLVEAKTYAVPTVLYELPYLELLKDRKGYISVPRHDVAGAAEVICELLRNNDRRKQLALEAKSSINNFIASNPSHIDGWLDLIHSLENGQLSQPLPVNQDFINFVDSTISYCQEGINRHREEILRYQNLSKQYQEENNQLHAKIKSHQEELLYHRERIEQLNLLRKSEYDARMIERYAVCRDFVTKLCPLGTNRYVLIKKIAQVIYGLIKRGCQRERTRSSCDIGSIGGGVNH
ncbi:glycosyltransferase [uncultured Parasutterella sp.]|uniref:glycosyltransferase n=1 Tax=uncultured Parasutterella sp. TaxID=1263098 RepID=UPI0025B6B8DC|nr:glycosyltransferase [uncultured Parasutterella sp.]